MDNNRERVPPNDLLAQLENDVGVEDDVDIENDGDDDSDSDSNNDGFVHFVRIHNDDDDDDDSDSDDDNVPDFDDSDTDSDDAGFVDFSYVGSDGVDDDNDNDGGDENVVGNGNDHAAEISAVSRKLQSIRFRCFIMRDFHYDCHSRRCCLVSHTIMLLFFSRLRVIVYRFRYT